MPTLFLATGLWDWQEEKGKCVLFPLPVKVKTCKFCCGHTGQLSGMKGWSHRRSVSSLLRKSHIMFRNKQVFSYYYVTLSVFFVPLSWKDYATKPQITHPVFICFLHENNGGFGKRGNCSGSVRTWLWSAINFGVCSVRPGMRKV